VDLIDSIRQKIMVRFEQKRRIVRSLKGPLVPKVTNNIKLISRVLLLTTSHFLILSKFLAILLNLLFILSS
jgi:hypothetical protein